MSSLRSLFGGRQAVAPTTDESPLPPNAPLVSLRYAFFGGDVLTRGDVARLKQLAPAVTSVNFYGATETPQAMACFVVPSDAEFSSSIATIGPMNTPSGYVFASSLVRE